MPCNTRTRHGLSGSRKQTESFAYSTSTTLVSTLQTTILLPASGQRGFNQLTLSFFLVIATGQGDGVPRMPIISKAVHIIFTPDSRRSTINVLIFLIGHLPGRDPTFVKVQTTLHLHWQEGYCHWHRQLRCVVFLQMSDSGN